MKRPTSRDLHDHEKAEEAARSHVRQGKPRGQAHPALRQGHHLHEGAGQHDARCERLRVRRRTPPELGGAPRRVDGRDSDEADAAQRQEPEVTRTLR